MNLCFAAKTLTAKLDWISEHIGSVSEHPARGRASAGETPACEVKKVRYCHKYNEAADTNLQAVFDLILNAAVKNDLPQSELPAKLYIISDMEFNVCVENGDVTNFAYAKRRFTEHGYILPEVVFWNAASRNCQQPVAKNEQGAVLVSGCTPRIFSMLSSQTLAPYAMMMEILSAERYAEIVA